MKVVCAWCRSTISDDDPFDLAALVLGRVDDAVSHGICPDCFKAQEEVLAHMGPIHDHSTVMDHDVGGEEG